MPQPLLACHVLRSLTPDGKLLFATRCLRMFAYGMLSVIQVLYLTELGFKDRWGCIGRVPSYCGFRPCSPSMPLAAVSFCRAFVAHRPDGEPR